MKLISNSRLRKMEEELSCKKEAWKWLNLCKVWIIEEHPVRIKGKWNRLKKLQKSVKL